MCLTQSHEFPGLERTFGRAELSTLACTATSVPTAGSSAFDLGSAWGFTIVRGSWVRLGAGWWGWTGFWGESQAIFLDRD